MALTQVDQGLLGTYAQYTGFKNRIINGAMVIDQRNAGASVALSNTTVFGVDRWAIRTGTGTSNTAQQSSTVPASATFSKSTVITIGTGASPGSTGTNYFSQAIEGYNTSDFMWGTATAQSVTLSFWVRSSLTGSFGVVISNGTSTRFYPILYTINSANTWEYKTIVIPGDVTGTWATDNSAGVSVIFSLGAGSTYLGTSGAWTGTGNIRGVTGETQVVATSGATFYITGVQLEKGSTATSFDYRPYGTELQLCQRYYQSLTFGGGNSPYGPVMMGRDVQSADCGIQTIVTMRSSPTATITGSSAQVLIGNGNTKTPTSITSTLTTPSSVSFEVFFSVSTLAQGIAVAWYGGSITFTASAEL